MKNLPRLIVLSWPESLPGEAETVRRLFDRGLPTYHLRKPGADRTEMERHLRSLPRKCLGRVVLHSHLDLAGEFGLQGVHLRSQHGKAAGARAELPPGRTISGSTHDLQELSEVAGLYDYVFFSPVFPSLSKPGHEPRFTTERITRHLAGLAGHVIALGGVTAENIGAVKEMGFQGAAVLGAVWQAADPVLAWQEIEEQWR